MFLHLHHAEYLLCMPLRQIFGICLAGALLFGCGPSSHSDTNEGNDRNGSPTALVTAQELVFGSDYSGNYEIYRAAQDGAEVRQLTDDPAYDNWWPRISPNRKKILFYRAPFGEGSQYDAADLMVMDADGRNIKLLRAAGDDHWRLQAHAEWSPDGNELVMCGTSGNVVHLFVTDGQGAVLRQLTSNGAWNCDPSWSPDGRSIVFNRCEADCGGSSMPNSDIFTIPASGGQPPQRLTADTVADYDPYYSPDGASIAWLSNAHPNAWDGTGAWSIRIMNATGASQRNVIDDGQINSRPNWSLSGERIFFHRLAPSSGAAGRWRIFSIRPDGSHLTPIDPFNSGQSEYPTN